MELDMNSHNYSRRDGRPYRSHLHPACFACKKRRSRCRTQNSSEVCMMCQTHGTDCIFPRPDEVPDSPRKRQRVTYRRPPSTQSEDPATTHTRPSSLVDPPQTTGDDHRVEDLPNLVGIVTEAGNDSSHIVSPAVAGDNDILESYLSAIPAARSRCLARTSSASNRPLRPVRFNVVPRRPLGVAANQSPAASKCEVIEKYMDPNIDEYLNLWVSPDPALLHTWISPRD